MTLRIITLTCDACGTVVAGNVLEDSREMKCPGIDCEEVLRFGDLPEAEREYMLSHPEFYRLE